MGPNLNPPLREGVQPNVHPVLQPNHKSEGVQPNVNPSLQPNHESRGVQPNINPSLQPNHENGGVQLNVNPSLQPNFDSVPMAGSSEEPQLMLFDLLATMMSEQPNASLQPNLWYLSSEERQLSQPQSAGDEFCK